MAVEKGPKLDWTVLANSDLSTSQYKFVKFHGTATVDAIVAIGAITDKPLGVLNNNPRADEEGDVTLFGIQKVLLGGTVVRDDFIGTDAAGAGVKITPATDTTKYVCGRALESGVSGQVISVALNLATAYLAK